MSETELVCTELGREIDRLEGEGFRLDVIYPADEPHSAVLSRGSESLRLTTRPGVPALTGAVPAFTPEFVLTRAGGSPGEGRAGMLYRDLIPGRLGGRYIASHISIPGGGPVSDWVHYHRVAFQMLCVRRGWVRVVYEDQGEPFVMETGDLVLQPPGIRHQVIESSPGFEVVEIGAPALHPTFADHAMTLPNGKANPGRDFSGQHFLRHRAGQTAWAPAFGGEAQETRVAEATRGLAEARILRGVGAALRVPAHSGELVLGFVLEGCASLDFRGGLELAPGDCFTIPPGEGWAIAETRDDFRLLHVTTSKLDQKIGLAALTSSPL